jgi:hypothetical protein
MEKIEDGIEFSAQLYLYSSKENITFAPHSNRKRK